MLEADKNLYAAKTSGRNQLKAPSVVIKSISENHHAHLPIKSQSE